MTNTTIKTYFEEQGFFLQKGLLSKLSCQDLLLRVMGALEMAAQSCSTTLENYLSVASRWCNPSPITDVLDLKYFAHIRRFLNQTFQENFSIHKMNVISKTPGSLSGIPCHQDISYSPHSPYSLTTWIALHPMFQESGPLKVLPRSHKKIYPAVDFWDPHFKDKTQNSHPWKHHAQTFNFDAGDTLIFDSRLVHASDANLSHTHRFALAIRWTFDGFEPGPLPVIRKKSFGMWTCGDKTNEILRGCFLHLTSRPLPQDFLKAIDLWIKYLETNTLPKIDSFRAISLLKNLKVLHLAHLKHNAGDGQGTFYKDLWKWFLNPLQRLLP